LPVLFFLFSDGAYFFGESLYFLIWVGLIADIEIQALTVEQMFLILK